MRGVCWAVLTLGLVGLLGGASPAEAQAPNKPKDGAGAERKPEQGRVEIECVVTATGALTDCSIYQEAPAGRGLGEAALKLSEKFKMRTENKEGRSMVGAKVRIPIVFEAPSE